MSIIYSLPFFAVSLIVCFYLPDDMNNIKAGLIGLAMGLASLVLGILIDIKRNGL